MVTGVGGGHGPSTTLSGSWLSLATEEHACSVSALFAHAHKSNGVFHHSRTFHSATPGVPGGHQRSGDSR